MMEYFEGPGNSDANSVSEFKKVVPDAQSTDDFFRSKGMLASGEVFDSLKPRESDKGTPPSSWSCYVFV